jgi:hypothetical protein
LKFGIRVGTGERTAEKKFGENLINLYNLYTFSHSGTSKHENMESEADLYLVCMLETWMDSFESWCSLV